MKVIIAGSRSIDGQNARMLVRQAIRNSGFETDITMIVHGGARGVDRIAGEVCEIRWPVLVMKADWVLHGLSAGRIRNEVMAGYADALIAVWDGRSRGTKHMIDFAVEQGLKVYVEMCPDTKPQVKQGFFR